MAKSSAMRRDEEPPEADKRPGVVRGIRVPADVDREVVAACFALGHEFNYSRFATEAIEALLRRYRRRYNAGKPFEAPSGIRLKSGRPLNPPRRP